jgi:Concanavalin A-like lectin/glucanases superfamily
VVLIPRSGVLGLGFGLVLLGGCSESLFGAHPVGHGGDDAGSDGDMPGTCTGSCIADAAANFDGTAHGEGNYWRYLEDLRDRRWQAMMGDVQGMAGIADPNNRITTCKAHPESAACAKLPGALLVSAAGTGSMADPAIEFTAPVAKVIKLSLHVFVPDGDDQTIRLYRNSREDVLFTGTATAGVRLDHEITLDALGNDRFLVAIVPTGSGGVSDVGLHLTASDAGVRFPASCQLSLRFESVTGNSTPDLVCQSSLFTHVSSMGTSTALMLGAAPFLEQGNGVKIPLGTYLKDFASTDALDHSKDTTVQFWVRLNAFDGLNAAWPFSDLDVDHGGGLGVSITQGVSPGSALISAKMCTDPMGPVFAEAAGAYPVDGGWEFVRAVHDGTSLRLCVNGSTVMSTSVGTVPKGMYPPDLGKDAQALPGDAHFDGSLDDVRVISGALPCD